VRKEGRHPGLDRDVGVRRPQRGTIEGGECPAAGNQGHHEEYADPAQGAAQATVHLALPRDPDLGGVLLGLGQDASRKAVSVSLRSGVVLCCHSRVRLSRVPL